MQISIVKDVEKYGVKFYLSLTQEDIDEAISGKVVSNPVFLLVKKILKYKDLYTTLAVDKSGQNYFSVKRIVLNSAGAEYDPEVGRILYYSTTKNICHHFYNLEYHKITPCELMMCVSWVDAWSILRKEITDAMVKIGTSNELTTVHVIGSSPDNSLSTPSLPHVTNKPYENPYEDLESKGFCRKTNSRKTVHYFNDNEKKLVDL